MAMTAKEGCDKMPIFLYFRLRRGGKAFCDKSSFEVVGWGPGAAIAAHVASIERLSGNCIMEIVQTINQTIFK